MKKKGKGSILSFLFVLFVAAIFISKGTSAIADFWKGFQFGLSDKNTSDKISTIIIAWTATIIILIIVFLILKKRVSLPMKKISESMQQVEAGNLDTEIKELDGFEFRQIEEGFNSMVKGLREARRLEEENAEKNRELYAEIAHDLKTPMTMVLGYAKLLSNDNIPEDKRKEYLTTITEQTETANTLLEQMLEYAKLGTTEYKLDIKTGDIAECLRLSAADNYIRFEERNMSLDIDIPDNPVLYDFDENQMKRVFYNLIGNITKHNPEGTSVRIVMKDDKIYFADNGPLIDADLKDKLFEPFRAGEASKKTKGSGLGLSVAKKIIELHNAELEYKDEVFPDYKGFVISL